MGRVRRTLPDRHAVRVREFLPWSAVKAWKNYTIATEGGATVLSVDASSVENKWLGESEKNAKAVFALA